MEGRRLLRSSSFWGKLKKWKQTHKTPHLIRNEEVLPLSLKNILWAASPVPALKALTKQLCVNWRGSWVESSDWCLWWTVRLGQWRMKLPPRKPSQGLAGAGGAQGGQGLEDWAVSTSSLLLGLPPSASLMVVLPELQLWWVSKNWALLLPCHCICVPSSGGRKSERKSFALVSYF